MCPSADFFTRRSVSVRSVPGHVLEKARSIICRLEEGIPYWQMRGKRLQRDRSVISIPVGQHYRLLAVDKDGRVSPRELLSHAGYNNHSRHF
jgi:hypothetical protein